MISRKPWSWVDWSFFGIYSTLPFLAMLVIYFKPEEIGNPDLQHQIIYTCWFVIAYAIPLIVWRPGYTHRVLFPLLVTAMAAPIQLYFSSITQLHINVTSIPSMVAIFVAYRQFAIWYGAGFIAFFMVADAFIFHKYEIADFIGVNVDRVLLLGIGYGVRKIYISNERMKSLLRQNEIQYQQIQEQNQALEQYSRQIEQITLLEERNRMARELHDTVGHTFTTVVMGLDAVAYLLDSGSDRARDKLEVLRELTRNGLEEVRRSIHQISPTEDDATLVMQLSRISNEFAVHTGTQVRMGVVGEEFEVPKMVRLALVRCLQESLTNAKRHGHAACVEVKLVYGKGGVELLVEDDGNGAPEHTKAGFGLTSMKDRMDALQGELVFRTRPGQGASVCCKIPVRRYVDEPRKHDQAAAG